MEIVRSPAAPGRQTIPALLSDAAAAWPDHGYLWLEDGERRESRLDYGALQGRVAAVGAGLVAKAAKGERVLILLPPGPDYILAVLATAAAGLIAVPVYPPDPANQMMGLAQVRAILHDSLPSFGLTNSGMTGLVEAAAAIEPALTSLPWLNLAELESAHAGAGLKGDVGADDVAVLLYTSGSTGAPKGVMLSHANLADTAAAMACDCRLGPDGRLCAWVPGYHVAGLFGGIILPLWAGATVVGFAPRAFVERPRRWLEVISNYGVTFSGAPTFAYDVIARAIRPDDLGGLDLSRWVTAVVGGEAIRPTAMAAFARLLAPAGFRPAAIYTMFGQTEAAMITTGNGYLAGPEPMVLDAEALRAGRAVEVPEGREGGRVLLGSGRALPEMEFAIVDPATRSRLPDHSVGEIWLAGVGVGRGYWGKPDATRATFEATTSCGDGPYLRSGDLGFRAKGQVHVVGRMKEVIILRGLKFYPEDLEATALGADARLAGAECAAFGFDGPSGEELLAVAVEVAAVDDGAARQDLASSIRRAVVSAWAVQVNAVVLCPPGQLPRTRTAKVQRVQCAAQLTSGAWEPVGGVLGTGPGAQGTVGEDGFDALTTEAFAARLPGALAALIAQQVGVRPDQVVPGRAIADFGIDSMAIVQLSLDISNRFRVSLSGEALRREQTVAALAAAIMAQRAAAPPPAPARAQARRLRAAVLRVCRGIARTELVGRHNLPLRGPAILAVNHVNSLDAPLLAAIMPQEWPLLIASAHLARRPVTDRLLRALFRPLYVDLSLALSFVQAIEALRQGEVVGIAPEGRLNTDGVLDHAKPGAAYLAAVSGAPVIPVAISGQVAWKRRLLALQKLQVRIECGPPIRCVGTRPDELARNTDAIMSAIAAMLPARYRGRYAATDLPSRSRAA